MHVSLCPVQSDLRQPFLQGEAVESPIPEEKKADTTKVPSCCYPHITVLLSQLVNPLCVCVLLACAYFRTWSLASLASMTTFAV